MICVDDQLGIRILLNEIFKDEYEVVMADSGSKAINLVKDFQPDVVLLDVKLGDMNGADVLGTINSINSNIKTIVMTGYNDDESLKRVEKLKPHMIINKPFDVNDIRSKVKEILY